MNTKTNNLDDEPLELDQPGKDVAGLNKDDADDLPDTTEKTAAAELDIVIVDDDQPATDADALATDAGTDVDAGAQDVVGDDGLEEGDKGFSKNVQERIKREIRVRKREVEAAEGRVREEATARHAAETRMLGLELSTARMASKTLATDIKEAKAELIAAQEGGKTTEAVDAQEKLNLLQIRAREVETMTTTLEAKVEHAKTAPVPGAKPKLRPITEEWMGRNKWFGTDKFEVATGAVKTLSAKLEKEGISPDDPRHYTELDRRLHLELPSLRQRLKAERPQRADRPGPGTTVSAVRNQPSKPANPNRVTLNRADLKNMRDFGMDPAKKEDLQAYARSKQGEFHE